METILRFDKLFYHFPHSPNHPSRESTEEEKLSTATAKQK